MTVRHPGNPAVQRSFTRQISGAYTHGGVPSLRTLNRDLPGGNLSVNQGVGAQIGIDNIRTDRVSVDIRGLALTGWDSMTEQVAAKIDKRASAAQAIDGPGDVVRPAARPAARLALGIRRPEPPFESRPPDPGRGPGRGIGRL